MLTLMTFVLILNSFFPLVCSTECRLLFSVLCKNTCGTVCCHQRRSGFVRMLVADTEPQVRTRSYKRPRSMQEECEGTVWLPVDSELRPLPLMLSKNTPWLMRGEIMREGHKTVAEVKSSAAHTISFFLFLLSGSIPKFHFNSYSFLLPSPLGVPEGCNCRLWIYLLNQIMRSNWSDSCQKLLDVWQHLLSDQSIF